MTENQIFDLRRRCAEGEEITEAELREAITSIRQSRAGAINKPRAKRSSGPSEADDLIALLGMETS